MRKCLDQTENVIFNSRTLAAERLRMNSDFHEEVARTVPFAVSVPVNA